MTIADLKLSSCSSCGQFIYWLKNDTTGRPAPIDVRPDSTGPVIITVESTQLRYHVLTKAELAAGVDAERFQNHFMSCPNAAKHKKAG